ncbi:ABC transporter ATP-binding protein [Actinocatenispora rupis]|uniref:Sugar ABC transporter ATP-binding protein n=1 Tax=Actinocatenispora rupis TaxID=519421 RepID=A0A8J3J6L9_9ACTN|nr:ABC transporter ATP-binding protein [Actinocatenispora rupis]GID15795.1 sugar ABC transporter ATP-binding protein [Actinocatenispora rupis]
MAGIGLSGVTKTYPGGVTAVDGLDLTVHDGEFFALLGPSGCGKTTLLRTIAGLEQASAGTVSIGDRDVTRLAPGQRDVAMVFQDYALFPHMTVLDNIAYPLRVKRIPRAARHDRAREVGAGLDLADLMARRPAELSGGQQQRVALARAVVAHPKAFLFDEPLSNLDARLRLSARTFLKRLQRDLGITTVFVTHDQAEALAMADRIAVMDAGRIRQVGTPREVFGRPATSFVAHFIGSTPMNLLDATVTGGRLTLAAGTLPCPADLPDDTRVTVGIRPEYLTYSKDPVEDALAGTVGIVEHLGSSSLVTLETDGAAPVGVVVEEGAEPEPGTRGWAVPRPGRVLLYRAGGGDLLA